MRINWPQDGKIVRDYLAGASIITWVLTVTRRQKRENQRRGSTRGLDPPLPALKRKGAASSAGCRQLLRAETARSWVPFWSLQKKAADADISPGRPLWTPDPGTVQ